MALLPLLQMPFSANAQNVTSSTKDTIHDTGKKGIRFFAGANANFVTTSYGSDGSYIDNLKGAPSYHSTTPQVNIGTDIFFDKNKQAFIFRVELGGTTGKTSFTNNYNGGSNITADRFAQKMNFNYASVSLTPQIILNIYNSNSFKFYAGTGISIVSEHYSSKYYANVVYSSTTNTTQTTDETSSFPPLRSMVYYVPVKIGFVIDNTVDIYAGYSPKADMSAAIGQTSIASSSFQAGINYLFGGK